MKALLPLVLLFANVAVYAGSGYHVVDKLPLGGEGGWDYLTVDSAAHRLYISRSTHVMVVDTETGKLAGDILNTPGVHGIALAPDLNRGFISNGKGNSASIFDLKTLQVISQVKTGENPDAILFDPATKRVFAFNGKSKDVTVFDAVSEKVLATIALGGKPEFATTNRQGRVFVNIEDTSEVVELDSQKLAVVKRYSLAPGEEPSGMAADFKHNRIFSGCGNKLMTVLDVETGKISTTIPIGDGVDANVFDAETGLVFSSNGDGTLTVATETTPGKFDTETIATRRGARTMAIDAKTHKLYLPSAEYAPAVAGAAKARPAMIKDSFTVLVLEPTANPTKEK